MALWIAGYFFENKHKLFAMVILCLISHLFASQHDELVFDQDSFVFRAPLLKHTCPLPNTSFPIVMVSQIDVADSETETDDYKKLSEALHQDLKQRKVFSLQSTNKKPAELWTMPGSEATTGDCENNFESLSLVVKSVPHAGASASEIQIILMDIDKQHDYILSAARDKRSQRNWAIGEATILWHLWSRIRRLWRKAPKAAHSKQIECLKNMMVRPATDNATLEKVSGGSSSQSSPVRGLSRSQRSSCSLSPKRPSRGLSPACSDAEKQKEEKESLYSEKKDEKSKRPLPDEKEEEEEADLFMPRPPKPGERPMPGRYRDEDETKANLRASQAREEKKRKKCASSEEEEDNVDGDSQENDDEHLPKPKKVRFNDEVVDLGRSPIRESSIKIKKKPAGTRNASSADSESESISGEPTPPPKKRAGKPLKSSTPPPAKKLSLVNVGDKRWELRWKDILKSLPKECMPQQRHGEANWTVTDSDGTTSIQVQAKSKSFYVVKTKAKFKGPRTINVVRDFEGSFKAAWLHLKKKIGWNGTSKAM